jgi:hypothetical protein
MSPEEQRRLWEWTLHEDGVFSERQSLFLVAESMLVAGYAAALAPGFRSAALAIAGFGAGLTLLWLVVSWRLYLLVEYIQNQARAELPDYERLCKGRPSTWVRSRAVIAFGLPSLLLALWSVLLALRVG